MSPSPTPPPPPPRGPRRRPAWRPPQMPPHRRSRRRCPVSDKGRRGCPHRLAAAGPYRRHRRRGRIPPDGAPTPPPLLAGSWPQRHVRGRGRGGERARGGGELRRAAWHLPTWAGKSAGSIVSTQGRAGGQAGGRGGGGGGGVSRGGTTARHENRSKKLEAREGADLGKRLDRRPRGQFPHGDQLWGGGRQALAPLPRACARRRRRPLPADWPAHAHAIGAVFLVCMIPMVGTNGVLLFIGRHNACISRCRLVADAPHFFKWRRAVAAGPIYI